MAKATITNFTNAGTNSQITRTYYDAAAPVVSGFTNGIANLPSQAYLRKRVSASTYTETQGSAASQATYYTYDIDGNVKTLWQQVGGLSIASDTNTLKRIDYEYDLVSGKVNFVSYQDGQKDRFYYKYEYDAENRLTDSWSGRRAIVIPFEGSVILPDFKKLDVHYDYYLHGPLAREELGDQYGKVQGKDYAYTLQGWLKGVNGNSMATDIGADGAQVSGIAGTIPKDSYAFSLGYYGNDYKPIGGTASNSFAMAFQPTLGDITGQNLYNGNISNTTLAISSINSGNPVGYTYHYDQLNRLKTVRQHSGITGTWTHGSIIQDYGESLTYDGNGNLLTNNRNGNASTRLGMDSLTYHYNRDANGKLTNNQLRQVNDAVPNLNGYTTDLKDQTDISNYQYDAIGNLIHDSQANISNIDWTAYGKIKKIYKGSDTISYTYSTSGQRVSKKFQSLTTYYVKDAQGNTLAIYDNAGSHTNWREQHKYGSSHTGMWLPNVNLSLTHASDTADLSWNTKGNERIEMDDHLGNVDAVISDRRVQVPNTGNTAVDHYVGDVISSNSYFAFGMIQPGREYGTLGRYGFNGKENDNEVKGEGNQLNFDARIYDSRIGRWLSTDIVTKPFGSSYTFSANDPINYLDPDGQDEIHFIDLLVRQYFDGKLIGMKATKFSIVIKNNEPNVFIHHKLDLRYDGIGPDAKLTTKTPVNTRFYPDAPGHFTDRNTLIKYIDEYSLSKQDVDINYTEFSSPGSAKSDRLKKAQWWGRVFVDKAIQDENEKTDNINREFVLTGITFIAQELVVAKIEQLVFGTIIKSAEIEASVGSSTSNNYRNTFFKTHPELKYKVVVHHAIEKDMLNTYPGLFTESEIHSFENLRGIPKDINSRVHLSEIRMDWNEFYNNHPNATRQEVLDQATVIDKKYGSQFNPPVK